MVQDMSGSTLAPRCASEKGKTSTTAWMPKACTWRGTFHFFWFKIGEIGGVHTRSLFISRWRELWIVLHIFLTFKSTSSCQFLTQNRSTQHHLVSQAFNCKTWCCEAWAERRRDSLGSRAAGQTRAIEAAGWAEQVGEEHPGAAPMPPGLLFKHGKIDSDENSRCLNLGSTRKKSWAGWGSLSARVWFQSSDYGHSSEMETQEGHQDVFHCKPFLGFHCVSCSVSEVFILESGLPWQIRKGFNFCALRGQWQWRKQRPPCICGQLVDIFRIFWIEGENTRSLSFSIH